MAAPVGAALAQDVTPAPVDDESYQALGLRAGAFIAYPAVESGFEATDNVFNSEDGKEEDLGYYVEPSLRVESDWVRHRMRLEASSRHLFYFRNPSEDETQLDARASLRIDVLDDTSVEYEAGYSLDQEGRGEVDVPGAAARPPDEHRVDGSVALIQRFNRIEARLEGNAAYNVFENVPLVGGGTQNNADRNYVQAGGELRIGYDVSPKLQPFVEAGYSIRRHDQEIDDNGLRRNSNGFRAAAGVTFEPSDALSGEVSVGYVEREFDDPSLDNVEGLSVDADLFWQMSALTRFNLNATTSVDETGTAGSGGAIAYRVGAGVDHALRRHFLFGADVAYTFRDFSGSALSEETFYFAAGFTYQFTRQWAAKAGYAFRSFDNSSPGGDYTSNSLMLGLLWQN